MTMTSDRAAKLTLPSDREILIVRDFAAPRRLVFDAWSNREQVPRWYGCAEMAMITCEIDFREGGAWRWVTRMPDGSEHAFSGAYRTIARPERLAFTERYEPVVGSEHDVTLTFDEHDGVTTMRMLLSYGSVEARNGHLHSGMERGLEGSLARLEAVASAQAVAA
jgi:uncharacterized protein YndB with AHSA1/START domain